MSKTAVPIGKRGLQFAPPEAQCAQLEFDGGELVGGQCANAAAWSPATVAFRQDGAKLFHREPDRKCAANQPDAGERFGRIETIARGGPLWARQQPAPLIMTQRVRADAGPARQFTGSKRPGV